MVSVSTLVDDPEAIASIIEHTNVEPDATREEIDQLCDEVIEYGFHAAVVVPYHAAYAAERIGNAANVVTVIGFPYGIQTAEAKIAELEALADTVDELDMVINRTAFANHDDEAVQDDIEAVVEAAGSTPVKCIIESPALNETDIKRAAKLVEAGGADFVKTAVGYDGGTTPEDIRTIAAATDEIGIKASGGIGTFAEAKEMVAAGATRIGASSGVDIVESIST